MKKQQFAGAICAGIFSLGLASTSDAALIGVLPATTGGTDWQAYYDDQLDITWTANANINGLESWDNQVTWVNNLSVNGVTGWRLPFMDVNGDGNIVSCSTDQVACKDNEYGHLFWYGAGTVFGSGIKASNPGPFSNVQSSNLYWSGTEYTPDPTLAFHSGFSVGAQGLNVKSLNNFAWAVRSGNVSAVPVPAAMWLFGSGLLGLIGVAKRKNV